MSDELDNDAYATLYRERDLWRAEALASRKVYDFREKIREEELNIADRQKNGFELLYQYSVICKDYDCERKKTDEAGVK